MTRAYVVAAACLAILLSGGCEEGHDVTYVNRTEVTVDVYLGDDESEYVLTLRPDEAKTSGELTSLWPGRIIARDADGSTIFSAYITWDQLQNLDFEIIIAR
jgi:hypothetical protein